MSAWRDDPADLATSAAQAAPEPRRNLRAQREQFELLSRWVYDELGIQMPASKEPLLIGRLSKRLRLLGLTELEDYRRYLMESGPEGGERQAFIDAVTTNTTSFFREPVQFERLLQRMPELTAHAQARRGVPRVHVWSAGCSSGEEVYTLAMVLEEYCRLNPGTDYRILATDVSSRVLDLARLGVYRCDALHEVPVDLRKRYFRACRDSSQAVERVAPTLRGRISFYRLNFIEEKYPIGDEYDVVFFRNVAIYFDQSTQVAVIGRICQHLRVGGYLFLGQSEALAEGAGPLQRVAPSFYRRT